jgi:hypothetical protein
VKKSDAEFAATVARFIWDCRTWGELERAAGVTDRLAFWRDKTEDEVRTELRNLIAERFRRGELPAAN